MSAEPNLDDHSFSCSQFAIDIEGYSRIESGQRQAQVVKDLPDILSKAARLAHLDRDAWDIQPHGDGELSLIPVAVPKAQLVHDYIRELVNELNFYNRWRNEDGRLRVRVALHHGEARREQGNFPGKAPITVCRLLDSEPLKNALRTTPQAHLALILSDRMFEDTVSERERGLDPADYTRVEIKQEKWKGIGWVTSPGFAPPPLAALTTQDSGPSVPPGTGTSQVLHDHSRGVVKTHGPTTLGDNSPVYGSGYIDQASSDRNAGRKRSRSDRG
ncbi:MAG: hypothetical protein ACRD0K_03285 [Egibacteraceae bacterium]